MDLPVVWQLAAAIVVAVVVLLTAITVIDLAALWREQRRSQYRIRSEPQSSVLSLPPSPETAKSPALSAANRLAPNGEDSEPRTTLRGA